MKNKSLQSLALAVVTVIGFSSCDGLGKLVDRRASCRERV